MSSPQLSDLPPITFAVIARYLDGDEILNIRISNTTIKTSIDDVSDIIFTTLLNNEFDYSRDSNNNDNNEYVSLCVKSNNNKQYTFCGGPSVFGTLAKEAIQKCNSAFDCWKQWKRAHQRYTANVDNNNNQQNHYPMKATYFLRAARIFARLEEWLGSAAIANNNDDPESNKFRMNLRSTLCPGLSLKDLHGRGDNSANNILPSPPLGLLATHALWSFYGGQRREIMYWMGLMGGMSAYNYGTCTHYTGGLMLGESAVVGVCPLSYRNQTDKFFTVEPQTGRVKCHGTQYYATSNSSKKEYYYDAVLDWMDEYVRRLEVGYYRIGLLTTGNGSIGILHYPHSPVTTSRCVTRGIECCAMAILSPWSHGFRFVYSIQLRLLSEGEDGYEDPQSRGFDTCQLKSRHWRIRLDDDGDNIQRVDGDGVVGLYPLMREGSHRVGGIEYENNATFSYQSCTNEGVSFGGHMLFVPGSVDIPTGSAFPVHLAPFPLQDNPEYMY